MFAEVTTDRDHQPTHWFAKYKDPPIHGLVEFLLKAKQTYGYFGAKRRSATNDKRLKRCLTEIAIIYPSLVDQAHRWLLVNEPLYCDIVQVNWTT